MSENREAKELLLGPRNWEVSFHFRYADKSTTWKTHKVVLHGLFRREVRRALLDTLYPTIRCLVEIESIREIKED
jgi:hypothetical protein